MASFVPVRSWPPKKQPPRPFVHGRGHPGAEPGDGKKRAEKKYKSLTSAAAVQVAVAAEAQARAFARCRIKSTASTPNRPPTLMASATRRRPGIVLHQLGIRAPLGPPSKAQCGPRRGAAADVKADTRVVPMAS